MNNSKPTCPVCSAEKKNDSLRCEQCGFSGAYYTLFSGEKAYNMWKELVDKQRGEYIGKLYTQSREDGSELLVTGDRVCFYNAKAKQAIIVEFNNDTPEILEGVKQVSLSGLYRVWLNENGTLGSAGDDESGQRRVGRLMAIVHIATAPKCTYAVRADGTVTSRGATALKEQISQWSDIKSIACAEHVIGLKTDGTVVYALEENSLFKSYAPVMNEWKNVKKVVTSGYYALALCQDGTVLYAGVDDEKAQAANWKDIVDIAADGQYAIGLTASGDVVLAGEKSSLIDFDRSEAAEWKNMVFIASGRSVIAGLSATGELKIVGNMVKSDNLDETFKNAVYSSITDK